MLHRCLTTGSASATAVAVTCSASSTSSTATMSVNLFHRTPLLRRPQTIKPNPFVTEPGHFDRSFEKMAGTIQARMPQWKYQAPLGRIHDHVFGQDTEQDEREKEDEELRGRKCERPAAREARTFFDPNDDSAAAQLTRSARLKAAQSLIHPNPDKNLWRTTKESSEYYYPQLTLAQKRWRMMRLGTLWSGVAVAGWLGLKRLGHYMRYSG